MTEELKPCPFCGGDANAAPESQHYPGCYFDVLASLRAAKGGDISLVPEVLRAWNRRAQLPSQGGEAVAWMLADAVGGSMLEFQRDLLLEDQCRYGGDIVPLYTHPADQVADDLTMVKVSRELLEQATNFGRPDLMEIALGQLTALLATPSPQ